MISDIVGHSDIVGSQAKCQCLKYFNMTGISSMHKRQPLKLQTKLRLMSHKQMPSKQTKFIFFYNLYFHNLINLNAISGQIMQSTYNFKRVMAL